MHRLIVDLYPICRSITGDGMRSSLRMLQSHVPLALREVPSGTQVLDWTVPPEWNVREAFIANDRKERVIDLRNSTLHLVSYSEPVRARLPLAELGTHLHSIPEKPDLIPYRTSYYRRDWGFCLSQKQRESLADGEYEVVIDSSLEPGHLTYGELFLPGDIPDEVLLSVHCCHPSLCNDNLSGMALGTFLAAHLGGLRLRYSYRFLFLPGAIGALTWLALNEDRVHRIHAGLVAACVGDPGPFTYKRTRRGTAEIDRAVEHVLKHSGKPHAVRDFSPTGYDERQYCSPGYDLPVGSLMRTPAGEFPEYHTSADNTDFVRAGALEESLAAYLRTIEVLEHNRVFVNLNPRGEPQLGRRGLYSSTGGYGSTPEEQTALLWVLNFSDGKHTLLDIAERSGMRFGLIRAAAARLQDAGLLREAAPQTAANS